LVEQRPEGSLVVGSNPISGNITYLNKGNDGIGRHGQLRTV
jgi:hypothetical protein